MSAKDAEMHEGQEAFDRFRKAMKTISSVPKSAVVTEQPKASRSPTAKRKATKKR
jgi:hypothetical protein